MRTKKILYLCAVASMLLISNICHAQTAKPSVKQFNFTSFDKSATFKIDKSTYATINASGLFPTQLGNANITKLKNALTQTAFGTKGSLNRCIESFFSNNEIVSGSNPVKVKSIPNINSGNNISESKVEINIETLTQKLTTFSVTSYTYGYGAAHGYGYSKYVNYYIPQNILLTTKNLFKQGTENEIVKVLQELCRMKYKNVQHTNIDNVPEIIKVTANNISFEFPPYEIAPYAEGTIKLEIEAWKLYDYLTPLALKVFEINY